jgi:predicted enzyme related to lactoylglutathione lyase
MLVAGAKYVHTNLIARDWSTLVEFYKEVFGCTSIPPERHFSGPDLEAGTGVRGAELRGVHLRLPGCGADGPSLEILQYSQLAPASEPVPNRPGFAHIAFSVPSVPEARFQVLSHGGSPVGDIVTLTTTTGSRVTWCYVADPEGNILELQSWS